MDPNAVVSREEWIAARKQLLAKEKEFTRLRDDLSQQRRNLPWVKVDKAYVFDGPNGKESLSDLFDGRGQLVIYHFMFHPDWDAGCRSCSLWADNFDRIIVHLNQRNVSMIAVSRAPLATLQAFRARMGWGFKWISSFANDFNSDFHVSFNPDELARGAVDYNYTMQAFPGPEAPGISVFYKDSKGAVFHTYSCYSRGLDMLNGAYHYLDLVPEGRNEGSLPYTMSWVRHHDSYGA